MTEEKSATVGPVFRSNCEVAIHVSDLAKAEMFYGRVLGFRVAERSDDYLAFDTGALTLYVIPNPAVQRTFIPSYDVEDYAAARRYLESAGCTTVPAHEGGPGFYFQDPFGFVFDIVERKSE